MESPLSVHLPRLPAWNSEDAPSSSSAPRGRLNSSDAQTKARNRAVSIATPEAGASDQQDDDDDDDDEFEVIALGSRNRRAQRFKLARLQDCYEGKAVKERLAGVNAELVRLNSSVSMIDSRLSGTTTDAGAVESELEAWLVGQDAHPSKLHAGEYLADASRPWIVHDCGMPIDRAPKEARAWLERRKTPVDPWIIEHDANIHELSMDRAMQYLVDDMVAQDDRQQRRKGWRYHIGHLSHTKTFMVFGVIVLLATGLFMAWEARAMVNYAKAEALAAMGNVTEGMEEDFERTSAVELALIVVTWLEVVIRILGCSKLTENPIVIFDTLVILAWTTEYVTIGSSGSQFSFVAMLRVVRLYVGVYQNSRNAWLKPLHIVMHAGFLGNVDMFNILLLMAVFVYFWSVTMALAIGPASGKEYPEGEEPPFAELGPGFITWVQCIINGIEWGPEVLDKLLPGRGGPSEIGVALFIIFIWFAQAGPMNLIASLLIERTCVARQQFAKKTNYKDATALDDFQLCLEGMSVNDTRLISWPDVRYLLHQQPQHLRDMGVTYEDVHRLFYELRGVDGFATVHDLKFAIVRHTRELGSTNIETLSYQQRQLCEVFEDFDSHFTTNTKVLSKLVQRFGKTAKALACDTTPLREELEELIGRIRSRVEADSEEKHKGLEDMAAKHKKGEEAKREAEHRRVSVATARGSLALNDAFFAPTITENLNSAGCVSVAFHKGMQSWFQAAEQQGRPQMAQELFKALSKARSLEEETDETSPPAVGEQAAREWQRPAEHEQGYLLGTALAPASQRSTNPLWASSAIAPAKPGSSLGRIVEDS